MSSYTVLYEGQRRTVKSSGPGALILHLLQDAATQFNIDVSRCSLKHKKTTLDVSLPVRFAGIPNNAMLDLVVTSSSSSSAKVTSAALSAANKQPTKVALTIHLSQSQQKTHTDVFPSDMTLSGMFDHHIALGNLPPEVWLLNPELVYMSTTFTDPIMIQETSFVSLGLAGQSVRFQLRFKGYTGSSTAGGCVSEIVPSSGPSSPIPTASIDAAYVAPPATTPAAAADEVHPPSIPWPIVPSEQGSSMKSLSSSLVVEQSESSGPSGAASPRSTHNHTTNNAISPSNGYSDRSIVSLPLSTGFDSTENSTKLNTSEVLSTPALSIPTPSQPMEVEDDVPTVANVPSVPLPSPREAITLLLSSNFDAASKPAVITMYKYIANILSKPLEVKYRSINTSNKVFIERVSDLSVKYGVEFLLACGFVRASSVLTVIGGEREGEREKDTSKLTYLVYSSDDVQGLEEGIYALEYALDELQVTDEKERPKRSVPASSLSPSIPVVEFDPFKSMVVRTAVQVIMIYNYALSCNM